MNRKNFTKAVTEKLRRDNIKKPVHIPKQIFHISDSEGNGRDFAVKQTDKSVIFTQDDVSAIVDACVEVIQEALKNGEAVTFQGFGSLGLHYRRPRRTKLVGTGEEVFIEGHYIPKFSFGNDLRVCAKVYESKLQDRIEDPDFDDDDFEDEEVLDDGD